MMGRQGVLIILIIISSSNWLPAQMQVIVRTCMAMGGDYPLILKWDTGRIAQVILKVLTPDTMEVLRCCIGHLHQEQAMQIGGL